LISGSGSWDVRRLLAWTSKSAARLGDDWILCGIGWGIALLALVAGVTSTGTPVCDGRNDSDGNPDDVGGVGVGRAGGAGGRSVDDIIAVPGDDGTSGDVDHSPDDGWRRPVDAGRINADDSPDDEASLGAGRIDVDHSPAAEYSRAAGRIDVDHSPGSASPPAFSSWMFTARRATCPDDAPPIEAASGGSTCIGVVGALDVTAPSESTSGGSTLIGAVGTLDDAGSPRRTAALARFVASSCDPTFVVSSCAPTFVVSSCAPTFAAAVRDPTLVRSCDVTFDVLLRATRLVLDLRFIASCVATFVTSSCTDGLPTFVVSSCEGAVATLVVSSSSALAL
jgi:hypothetical protein